MNKIRLKIISDHISIGNQLLFTPFLRALKSQHPNSYITTNSKIMVQLTPELFDDFDGKSADTAIILIPNFFVALKNRFKYKKIIGFRYRIKGKFNGILLDTALKWDWSKHEVDNNRKFLPLFNLDDDNYNLTLKPLFHLPKPKKLIGVHPGGRIDKRWSADYFSKICDKLIASGYKVALFGGPEEIDLSKRVRKQMKNEVYADYTGMTTLPGVISFINTCDFFFCNDGGLMHIASALKKPVAAIFGPTDFVKNGPYNDPHWIITNEIPCRPCYHFATIKCTNKNYYECLNELKPEKVWNILEHALKKANL